MAAGAAFTGGGSNPDFALARYNRDGTLDASFGTGGKVTTDFAASHDVANALMLQHDGKLVAARLNETAYGTQMQFALARYNPDGSLDASFGTGGKATTYFSDDGGRANALVLQANGKLVAAGGAFGFALARYNRDGTLDASFGSGGKVITDFAGGIDQASALVVQERQAGGRRDRLQRVGFFGLRPRALPCPLTISQETGRGAGYQAYAVARRVRSARRQCHCGRRERRPRRPGR